MTTAALQKRVERKEKEIIRLKRSQSIFPKMFVDDRIFEQASTALFDFDIEEYVTKDDLKRWKS